MSDSKFDMRLVFMVNEVEKIQLTCSLCGEKQVEQVFPIHLMTDRQQMFHLVFEEEVTVALIGRRIKWKD